jgi:WD repeat-containing protein 70
VDNDLDADMAGPSLALFVKPELTESTEVVQGLPISNEVRINAHTKGILALAIDREGYRMATGGLDYQFKLFDFQAMNQTMRPFKDFKPFDGHPVSALSWAPSGEHLLVCCPNNQARVYSGDGVKEQTTVRGDMYLHDMSNTKGHTSSICDGKWSPRSEQLFATCSLDGTIRQWDLKGKLTGMDQQL